MICRFAGGDDCWDIDGELDSFVPSRDDPDGTLLARGRVAALHSAIQASSTAAAGAPPTTIAEPRLNWHCIACGGVASDSEPAEMRGLLAMEGRLARAVLRCSESAPVKVCHNSGRQCGRRVKVLRGIVGLRPYEASPSTLRSSCCTKGVFAISFFSRYRKWKHCCSTAASFWARAIGRPPCFTQRPPSSGRAWRIRRSLSRHNVCALKWLFD